jgi:hypothetical protein
LLIGYVSVVAAAADHTRAAAAALGDICLEWIRLLVVLN